jgi:dipeptidyl aminopeptidase/acylaminoacyl peptidase
LLGGSGGGHLALLVAADAPRLFAAVSSWVPATDLTTFYLEKPNPCSHIEAFCGGPPGKSSAVDLEYRERSPLFRAADLALANLSIHHGRHDNLVHWTHTFRMAKEIAAYHPERLYFEIFDGGHEIGYDRAFAWFERQRNEMDSSRMNLLGGGHARSPR